MLCANTKKGWWSPGYVESKCYIFSPRWCSCKEWAASLQHLRIPSLQKTLERQIDLPFCDTVKKEKGTTVPIAYINTAFRFALCTRRGHNTSDVTQRSRPNPFPLLSWCWNRNKQRDNGKQHQYAVFFECAVHDRSLALQVHCFRHLAQ